METIKTKVLVVGGGPGGYVAAIRCGQLGLDTVLVLSGVTTVEEMKRFPYRPRLVLNGVGDIPG